jgi:cell division protein FtsI (penicillin-binding protein 3)
VTRTVQQRRARIGALAFALAGLFMLAVMRLVALVALDGSRLNSLARSEHTSEAELAAARGPIVDRHGEPLALSAETRSVYARPQKLLASTTPAERAELARALAMKPAELQRRLRKPAPFVWLRRRIDPEKAQAVEALALEGVGALSEYKRFYPESTLAASVVGLAGMDGQGLSGIEVQYDRLIRGEPVELRFYHDALGHPIFDSPLALKSPEPGAELKLTIDARIQSLAENELAAEIHASNAKHGTVIVLDPFSGEVLALANVSARPDPLRDRLHDAAVQDAFEPGSTIKALLASIALSDRTVSPGKEIYCEEGRFRVGGRTIHDDSRHGWLDLGGIIEVSSNIGAAKIALQLGADRYYRGLRAFGLGRLTGIDLPGEATGILRAPSSWREIDLANHGFGQGIAVTPIQLAVAYAAIANGGLLMRPYVVRSAYDAEGRLILRHTPQVMGRVIAPAVAHTVNVLLRGVVNGPDGTARRARVDGFVVAGKTGTAQMVDPVTHRYFQNRHVASFVGFLPADDPRLVILVVLYDVGHGHFGGLVAAPVFSEIASGAVRDLNIASEKPTYDVASLFPVDKLLRGAGPDNSEVQEAERTAAGERKTPDFRGMSLRHAFEVARRIGANLEVRGAGYVVAQEPSPGAPLSATAVKLSLAPAATGAHQAVGTREADDLRPKRHGWRRGHA